ncbi:MAG TPA: hypothetical protein VGI60_10535 [Chthoniobacterales bacterium]|jgi:hypothetical protein
MYEKMGNMTTRDKIIPQSRNDLGLRGAAIVRTAIGAVALGALAIGAVAIGALTIGRLVIRRLTIEKADLRSLEVRDLTVTGSLRLPEDSSISLGRAHLERNP